MPKRQDIYTDDLHVCVGIEQLLFSLMCEQGIDAIGKRLSLLFADKVPLDIVFAGMAVVITCALGMMSVFAKVIIRGSSGISVSICRNYYILCVHRIFTELCSAYQEWKMVEKYHSVSGILTDSQIGWQYAAPHWSMG